MGGMAMPGGWTMSMVWMRTPEQTWFAAAASFLGMWIAMMAAMMLPSLVPILRRYRATAGSVVRARLAWLIALVTLGYFIVWAVAGLGIYPAGIALAAIEMAYPAIARLVPMAVGAVVLIAGASQFTAWKARHLACCRTTPKRPQVAKAGGQTGARTALRHGLCLGVHCVCSSAALTAVLLVLGMMDARVMAATTAAITLERLAPAGEPVARVIGVGVVGLGLVLVARAIAAG